MTGRARPTMPDADIDGVLRWQGKMEIVGAAKSYKSMEAIYLALMMATGGTWRGHGCADSTVLYVNTELTADEFANRLDAVRAECGIDPADLGGLAVVSLRGETDERGLPYNLETLASWIEDEASDFSVVVIDPIYKVLDCDENDARAMARAMATLDEIGAALGATVIYVHHTAKGAGARMGVADAGRGSSVLGGDADAIAQIVPLHVPRGSAAWGELERMGVTDPSCGLYEMRFLTRSFPDLKPLRLAKVWPMLREVEGEAFDAMQPTNAAAVMGGEANARRHEAERARRVRAVAAAVASCEAEGAKVTGEAVAARLGEACEAEGIAPPTTSRSARKWYTDWRKTCKQPS